MRKQYDSAYKIEVCQAIESGTSSVAGMSRETGIPENTIRMWMRRYREHKDQSFVGSGRVLPENEELVRLKREVRDLREENEILKKAAAYFAKHQK